MTQNLAFEIGAAFFLAVLVIAGTMTRGLFPTGMFKNVKLTLGVATVMVGGYAAYRALPDVSSWWPFGSNAAAAEPEPEGKGKKVLQSVGRFLHIVKKKDDGAKDAAQTP